MNPPTPTPSLSTIKPPAPLAPTEKRVAPASSIRDGTRRGSIYIAPMPDALQHFWLDPVVKRKEISWQGPTPSTEKGMTPRVATTPPRVVPIEVVDDEPVAHRICSRISALYASGRTFSSDFIKQWAASEVLHGNQWTPLSLSVIRTKTGESLEHRALRHHPCLAKTWNMSYSNDLG